MYMRGGATYSSSVRDGALVALRERVVEQNDRAEVVAAAATADGVVVLCRSSSLLTERSSSAPATTAPRVDPGRSVALRGEAAGDVNVASCAGRVFIRKGESSWRSRRGGRSGAWYVVAAGFRGPGGGLRRESAFWEWGCFNVVKLRERSPAPREADENVTWARRGGFRSGVESRAVGRKSTCSVVGGAVSPGAAKTREGPAQGRTT